MVFLGARSRRDGAGLSRCWPRTPDLDRRFVIPDRVVCKKSGPLKTIFDLRSCENQLNCVTPTIIKKGGDRWK